MHSIVAFAAPRTPSTTRPCFLRLQTILKPVHSLDASRSLPHPSLPPPSQAQSTLKKASASGSKVGVLFKDSSGVAKSGVQGFIARRVTYLHDVHRNSSGFVFRSCQKCEVVGGIERDDDHGMVGAVELK